LQDIKTLVKTQVDKKSLSFDMAVDERLASIHADKQKFKQIMINLIGNAIKFTPKGGNINVRANRIDESVQISIIDTGIGIKPEDQGRIFKKFQQIDSKTAREYGGTGLGLALSKKFVEMHGGKIWFESEYGKGSAFTFTIPLQPAGETPVEEVSAVERIEREGKRPLILVVEDDPKSSELLKIYLTQEGYDVATAFAGKEAIKTAKELKPMAITLDIILPGKSGWDVLKELKELPETKDIPVIIVSILEEKERGFSLGAVDYLVKPIKKEELLRVVNRYSLTMKPEGKPVNILVIDDEPKTVELMAAVLEAKGYNVHKAYGGQEGIDLAIKQEHDLIILDLMMPAVDGFDVVEELKKHTWSKDVPIIISTAKDLTEEDFLRLKGKVESIARKGKFSKDDLLRQVRKLEKIRTKGKEKTG
jgi:DNA-binding response OmpR family regulator